jgi:hypothetical protein
MGQTRCVVHYPNIPEMWPVKVGTNLTQTEVEGLESAGFKIDDGEETLDSMHQRFLARDGLCQEQRGPRTSGDIRPTVREGKSFRFVPQPSPEHFARMDRAKNIECTIVKYLKVPSPGYGIVYTVHTPGSISKQQLYEVTIGDYPACSCIDFISMKASALGNGKKKWICCKHLYFILQQFLGATIDDKFVHCPAWTPNEVKMLLERSEVINSRD